ncbi:MAG: hypothetical protein WHS82_02385 [Candidatus Methanosuratincola sp.]
MGLQRELVNLMEEYIKAHPEMGYKSVADFVTDAVTEKCSELKIIATTPKLPQLEHFNISESGLRILDRAPGNGTAKGRIMDVYFKQARQGFVRVLRHVWKD